MAIRPLARPGLAPVRSVVPAAPPVEVTIEEARKRFQKGSFELAVAEIKELQKLKDEAAELVNSTNRQKTKVKNAFQGYAVANDLKPSDEIQMGDMGYRFDYSRAEVIDPEKFYDMFVAKEITKAQFLASIIVAKTEATRIVGEHKIMGITGEVVGKKMDLRSRELDNPVAKPMVVKSVNTTKEKLLTVNTAPPNTAGKILGRPLMIKRNLTVIRK